MVNRLTGPAERTLTVGTSTWTAPAGVTCIAVQSKTSTATSCTYPLTFLAVVPGTTYTITVNDTSWDASGDSGTFGSLLTFPTDVRLLIVWGE